MLNCTASFYKSFVIATFHYQRLPQASLPPPSVRVARLLVQSSGPWLRPPQHPEEKLGAGRERAGCRLGADTVRVHLCETDSLPAGAPARSWDGKKMSWGWGLEVVPGGV